MTEKREDVEVLERRRRKSENNGWGERIRER